MKVYLDDIRKPPTGWTLMRWPDEVIKVLRDGVVDELSLDHDLGDDRRGTGYDVILWLEREKYFNKDFPLPRKIAIHTANVSARRKMEAGVRSLYK